MFLIACIANPYLQSCIARKDAAKEWRLLVKYIMKPLSSKMKIALNNANETIETRLWKMFAGSLQLFVRNPSFLWNWSITRRAAGGGGQVGKYLSQLLETGDIVFLF